MFICRTSKSLTNFGLTRVFVKKKKLFPLTFVDRCFVQNSKSYGGIGGNKVVHGALPITYGKSPYPITSFDGTSAIIRKEIIEDFKNFLISFCEINIFLVDYTFLFLKNFFFFIYK